MRIMFSLLLAGSLLGASVAATPVLAGAGSPPDTDTIAVTCSNGFTRNVEARAARGVAVTLNRFSAFTQSRVECSAGPGAPRLQPAQQYRRVQCTNGFTRQVRSRHSAGIVRALDRFNAYGQTGVTCSLG